jgi:hypothetical protein
MSDRAFRHPRDVSVIAALFSSCLRPSKREQVAIVSAVGRQLIERLLFSRLARTCHAKALSASIRAAADATADRIDCHQ